MKERNAWEKWLNEEKTAIVNLTQQIEQLERELNQKVYALFGLTEEEILLLEENV